MRRRMPRFAWSEAVLRSSLCDSKERCHARDSRATAFFCVDAGKAPGSGHEIAKKAGSLPPSCLKPCLRWLRRDGVVGPAVERRIAGLEIFLAQPRHQLIDRDDV